MKYVSVLALLFLTAFPAWADETVHHTVQLIITPSQGTVQVTDHMTLTGKGPTDFGLSSDFQVQSLAVDGVVQSPQHLGDVLKIKLGSAGLHNVNLITKAKLKNSKQLPFLTAEGGLVGEEWLAQPKDRKATWDISGQTPKGQKWLTAGTLQSERETDSHYFAHFKSLRPARLPVLITGPFQVDERWTGKVRLRTYFHAELAPLAESYLDHTARYIEAAIQNIGPYPYAQFSIVSGVAPVGWGLPGMTYMGRRVLALPFIRTTSLPHEVLHNWWGNAVDVDYETGNWAEGLTTFQADLVQSALKHKDSGKTKRIEWLRNYAALPMDQDLAVNQFTSKTHDAAQVVGYGKTAFVFHMLKKHMGEAAFQDGIRLFYQQNKFKTARWSDLQTAFETSSHQDLSVFFKLWLAKPGAVELSLQDASHTAGHMTFKLSQDQPGGAYPLDIPVRFTTAKGDTTTVVRMDQKQQTFNIQTAADVLSLSIDPDFDVFRRLSHIETPPILRDVTLNPNTTLSVEGHDPQLKAFAVQVAEHLLQRPLTSQTQNGPNIHIQIGDMPLQAEAYVKRSPNGRVTLFITAQSIADLAKLARVLPHYKRRSFVKFQGDRVVEKGVWPMDNRRLTQEFTP